MQRYFDKVLFVFFILISCGFLNACSTQNAQSLADGPPNFYVDASKIPDAVPRKEPKSAYGNQPLYKVNGKRYSTLRTANGYNQRGVASWYGRKFHGKLTSSREPYNMLAMTAASPVLPIPSYVRVTNLDNGRQVVVKVNDRGPFKGNRIMDLSYAAAQKLGYAGRGTAHVQVTAITSPMETRPMRENRYAPQRPVYLAQKRSTQPPLKLTPAKNVMLAQKKVYLQLGSFSQFNNANQLKIKLRSITPKPIRIAKINSSYRVQIGPLRTDESNALHNKLRKNGLPRAVAIVL